ncbi:MFS transporter [Gluconacetobacter sp. Hr-1-5]|uniref:MFS transporter n=1 Tax=Gluconacetobacter sp. Hr-1-5 TaxID=3395370 RepID=UPI003B516F0C
MTMPEHAVPEGMISAPAIDTRPKGAHLVQMALVVLGISLVTLAREAFFPLQPFIQHSMALSNQQVALLQGLAIGLPEAVLLVVFGIMSDSVARHYMMRLFVTTCIAGVVLTGLAPGFVSLLCARFLVGVGYAGACAVVMPYIADLAPVPWRGRALAAVFIGQIVSNTIGMDLGANLLPVIDHSAWRHVFPATMEAWRIEHIVAAAAMLLLTLPLLRLVEPRKTPAKRGRFLPRLRSTFQDLLQFRRVLLPVVTAFTLFSAAEIEQQIWSVPLLAKTAQLSVETVSGALGSVLLISSILGVLIGGALCDRTFARYGNTGAVLAMLACYILDLVTSLTTFAHPFALALGLYGLDMVLYTVSQLYGYRLILDIIGSRHAGAGYGMINGLSILVSMGIMPSLVVAVSSHLPGDAALNWAVGVSRFACVLIASLILTLMATRSRRPQDT